MPRGVYKRMTPHERFLSKVAKDDSGCWLWCGTFLKDGYGNFNVNRKSVSAHRFSYQHYKGTIPEGSLVRHTCDVPKCCNPEHLILGTPGDNYHDAKTKGRHSHGSKHGNSKYTETEIRKVKILLSKGKTTAEVKALTGVSSHVIYDVRIGKTWCHVKL